MWIRCSHNQGRNITSRLIIIIIINLIKMMQRRRRKKGKLWCILISYHEACITLLYSLATWKHLSLSLSLSLSLYLSLFALTESKYPHLLSFPSKSCPWKVIKRTVVNRCFCPFLDGSEKGPLRGFSSPSSCSFVHQSPEENCHHEGSSPSISDNR